MNNATKEFFYFIRHPKFDSFAIIRTEGALPTDPPIELKKLMPGNSGLVHEGVVVEQDAQRLDELQRALPDWFNGVEKRPRELAGNIPYRLVVRHIAM
ncbi:hypothetical protein EXS57_00950 [Candidatus Kaiserbacteria bacterium]|nr:hypothetical protein [Candidatus Kaiserbacteria bacterium]